MSASVIPQEPLQTAGEAVRTSRDYAGFWPRSIFTLDIRALYGLSAYGTRIAAV